jgi:hypothetical protein
MIHDAEDYPPVCKNFKASIEHCGESTEEALRNLVRLEEETRPMGRYLTDNSNPSI